MTHATLKGKPNLEDTYFRFCEGEVAPTKPGRGSLLYKPTDRREFLRSSACAGLAVALSGCMSRTLPGVFDITAFGAEAGGEKLCTGAIQAAIDAAAANGGGEVFVPSGTYKTGTIYLKSHVTLHLAAGARIMGSGDLADYNSLDAFPQNFGSKREGWSAAHLILAVEQEDVAIVGDGTIDGNGRAFFSDRKMGWTTKTSWREGAYNARGKREEQRRPGQMIEFVECRNVRVRDVRIFDSPCWSCFFYGCEDVSVRGVRVRNGLCNFNTDGLDIDSCRNVTVSDCIIFTGDDAIAVRGSPGRLKDKSRVCENVTISNCVFHVSADGMRIGVGTGTIRRLRVSNVVVEHAGVGFHVQSSYSGESGVDISDISFSHCTVRDAAECVHIIGTGDSGRSRPRSIAFTDLLLVENDLVPDTPMNIVERCDGVVFNSVRIMRDGKPARALVPADVLVKDAQVSVK